MNKLYEMIDNNLSIIRKRILYNWYFEDIDIRNIISYIDDFTKYVYYDHSLDHDVKSRYLNRDMDYRDVIDWIDDIQSKMRFVMDQNKENKSEEESDKETIYNMIADLYDYVEDSDYIEKEYVLDQLASIQNYAK